MRVFASFHERVKGLNSSAAWRKISRSVSSAFLATFVDLPIARQNEVTRQIGTDRATVLKDWVALSGAW